VQEISFSGEQALARGQQVRFITERAVFALRPEGVTLVEIADGLDVQRDVVDRMGFEPHVADDLKPIDPRVYGAGVMGLAQEYAGR
jgi:acyl CoA:acetate/3-ketoacid CoA transferase